MQILAKPTSFEMITYDKQYVADFIALNKAWIEKDFELEPEDIRILNDPETVIIQAGGQIFFAVSEEAVLGTCALMPDEDGIFKLAKFAVSEAYQGQGVGRKLLMYAIDYAKRQQKKAVVLDTHSSLKAAIHLYQQLGFKNIPVPANAEFSIVDVAMRLDLA